MITEINSRQTLNFLIRLGLIFLLIVWCYEIIKPFIIPLVWGGIIAIAIYPAYEKFCDWTNQRKMLSAIITSLILLALLILPMVMLTSSSIDMVRYIAGYLQSGEFNLPKIQPLLAKVPLIGEWLQGLIVKEDLESLLKNMSPVLKTVGQKLLSFSAGLGAVLVQSLVSILIAGFFLLQAEASKQWFGRLSNKIADEKGSMLMMLAVQTTSNVAQGILGVALIQAILSGMAMVLAGVPAAGLWTLLALIVATIQLPVMLVLLPITIYLFYTSTLFIAISFLVWGIVISIVDTPMRAILMGRGSKTPILIIMMGALGGMLAFGIIGLFVGAVVLAVGYELFNSWLKEESEPTEVYGQNELNDKY